MSEIASQPEQELFIAPPPPQPPLPPPTASIPSSRSAQFTCPNHPQQPQQQLSSATTIPRIPLSASFNNNPPGDRNQNVVVFNGVHPLARPPRPGSSVSNGSAGKLKKASIPIPVPADPRKRLLNEKFPLPSYSSLSPYEVRKNAT